MTIDREQLTNLLVEKTGLDEEQVEGQLSELIKQIRRAAEKGKSFEIEGFGTFGMKDGVLQFSPHDRLETEINNKYAGMKPIELIGAFKEPEGMEIPDMPEESPGQDEAVWAFDEEAGQEREEPRETGEEAVAEEPAAETEDEKEEEEEFAAVQASGEEAQEAFEELIAGEEEDSAEDEPETEAVPETHDEQPRAEPVQASKGKSGKKQKVKEEQDDPIGKILVAAVLVIALGVSAFLMYDMGLIGGNGDGASAANQASAGQLQQTQVATADEGRDQPQQNESVSEDSEPEQQEQVVKQEETVRPESEQQQPPAYGLKGQVNSSLERGYTIVVHSLRSLEQAEQNRQKLEESGYRALINSANVQGTTYYRVGIGQFETVESAQEATDQLPDRYKGNNFIKRIQ